MTTAPVAASVRRSPRPMPAGFPLDKLWGGIHWHQRWEVFENVFTPGRNCVQTLCEAAGVPEDLRGMRVLDIGAWHGCFSFECERRGADEVVALTVEDDDFTGFSRLARAAGSRCARYVQDSVYNLDRRRLGEFDLVLFFGVLYHLRYPLLAIDRIRNVCRGAVLVETHVIDDCWLMARGPGAPVQRLTALHPQLGVTPVWRYYHNGELYGDRSNVFGPNVRAVVEGFESAGFSVEPLKRWGDRCSFRAVPARAFAAALEGTYEAFAPSTRAFLGMGPKEGDQRPGLFSGRWLKQLFFRR